MGTLGSMHHTGALTETLGHKSVLEKQRFAIEKLRTQNAKLKEDLLLENKFSVRPSNPGATILINKLQDEADLYTRKIQLEKRKVLMLEQQLEQMQAKLGSTRTQMGGIFSAKHKTQGLQKQIHIMENRLEKAYIKYNEAITYNKQLREQIDNLRRERMMFENLSTNLDRELCRIKHDIADMIAAANEAHAAKEKALAEAGALKLAAEREHQACEDEWKELTHIIEDDRRQRELTRANEMAERERRTQELLKSCEASAVRNKKNVRAAWNVGVSKVMAQNVSHDRMRAYSEAFEKIQTATGIDDMDALVAAFASAEDANYTLFNYVNEVNEEVEKLEDQISSVRAEMDKYRAKSEAAESTTQAAATSVTGRLRRSEAKAEVYEHRLANALNLVSAMRGSIGELFESIGCNTAPVRHLLGSDGVTEANLLGFLGMIEQRSNELMQAYALTKSSDHVFAPELIRTQPLAPPTTRIVIEPPSTQDLNPIGSDDENDTEPLPDDVPLTREALQAKVARNLPAMLERSLKVKPVGGAGGQRGRK